MGKCSESVQISARVMPETADRLARYCKESGQTKTVAIERAINTFIDEYEARMQILKDLKTPV